MYYCITSGKQTCYSGWKFEYTGFPMTQYKSYGNKDYVCVDKTAEPIDTDTSDKNGALFYGVRTTCDSLRCPPYKNHTEMLVVLYVQYKCVIYTQIKSPVKQVLFILLFPNEEHLIRKYF